MLYIFDVDGTLCDRESHELYPAVVTKLAALANQGHRFALATNQGGVGLRYWMEAGGFGDPEKLPTEGQVVERLRAIVVHVERIAGGTCATYVAYRYQSKSSGTWSPPLLDDNLYPEWSIEWRKPNAGMLLAAMSAAGADSASTVFVGDSPEDEQAAANAGVAFARAKEFFK